MVALEYYNLTKLILEDQSKIIEYKRIKLNTYSLDPFKDSIQPESVFIARSYKEPAPFVHLFVGGVGEGGTAIPFLKGCVRGMRVGIHHVNLRQAAQARGNTSGTTDVRISVLGHELVMVCAVVLYTSDYVGFSCLFFEPGGWGEYQNRKFIVFSVKLNGEMGVGGYHSCNYKRVHDSLCVHRSH